jgi:5'-nucleotidase
MNKTRFDTNVLSSRGSLPKTLVCLAICTLLSGCYFTAAVRDFDRPGGTTPWWCKGTQDLTEPQCLEFSWNLDVGVTAAALSPTLADFTGSTEVANRPANIGVAFTRVPTPTTFNPYAPNVFLYDGNTPTSRLVGIAWEISSETAPAGFAGDRDVWAQDSHTQNWWLTAWVIQGYQNHPNVFAASHPCLTSSGSILTSTADTCYTASHTEPLEILVANDDGVQAPGIDAIVEGLYALPNTVVHVVAPSANQSGAGGSTTPAPYVVSGVGTTTLSGKPATAVLSTDPADLAGSGSPADAVIFALGNLLLSPDVLISGINEGQNYSNIARIFSGTVGAARAGRTRGVPAIASSQGIVGGEATDYPAGVTATLALLEEWRLGRTVNTTKSVLNINIPTCLDPLVPRGTLNTVVKTALEPGDNYALQDCASAEPAENIENDLQAFNHGFIGITDINRTETLKVTSYNVGLALNFVPYTLERLVANEALLQAYDSDVICFQEVWLQDSVDAILQALSGRYPHVYIQPPEQVFTAGAACTLAEITPFANCALEQCAGLSGAALVACAPAACAEFLPTGTCLDGVIGAVGIPDVTVQDVVDTVTQPTGKFAFGGSLGLILASRHELKNRQFQDFIDNSSGNHRGALYAEIVLNERKHVVGCTHPTANLEETIAYPASGNFASWEEENRFMQGEMIRFANAKARGNPIFFAGDFNCSIANPGTGVDEDLAPSCQLWLDNGFTDPAAEQLPCTFCEAENLLLQPDGGSNAYLLDHVFVKNLGATAPIIAERVFDDPIMIQALNPVSELAPEDSPKQTHPSDHFGVQLDIRLP